MMPLPKTITLQMYIFAQSKVNIEHGFVSYTEKRDYNNKGYD